MMKHTIKCQTTRWHTVGIAFLIFVTFAHAEPPKIGKSIEVQKLKNIKKPTIIQKTIKQKVQPTRNLTQRYTATFNQPLKRSGTLTVNNIRWQCNSIQKQCTALNVKKVLSMQDCQQLASQQNQKLKKFGAAQSMFTFGQLSQCNTAVKTVSKTQKPARQNATYQAPTSSVKNIGTRTANVAPTPTVTPERVNVNVSAKLNKFTQLEHEIKQKTTLNLASARPNAYGGHGRRVTGNDCNDDRRDANPNATEICDHIDNNCDGVVDEGQTTPYYLDADGDNHGDPSKRVDACPVDVTEATNNGQWLVRVGNDCDDTDPAQWHDCR